MATTLFSWRVPNELELVNSDEPPGTDIGAFEIILNRCPERLEKRRRHLPHPEHETFLRLPLPVTTQVLRMENCRIRGFPTLPAGIHELYADGNDFFTLPDLSGYEHLIVLELADNRIDTLTNPWPPTLARLNLNGNILTTITSPAPPDGCNITIDNCTGVEAVVNKCKQEYMRAVSIAQTENQPYPAPPQVPLVPWIAARAPHIADRRREMALRVVVRRELAPPAGVAVAAAAGIPEPNAARNPYTEAQSVHDSGIQASTRANLKYIANYRRELRAMDSATLLSQISRVLGETPETGGVMGWIMGIAHRIIRAPPLPGPPHPPPAPAGNPLAVAGPAAPPPFPVIVSRRYRNMVLEELRERMASQYSMVGYVPSQIVERLWVRIMDFTGEKRETAIRRFVEEILEARGFCLNGFMTRMANVLVGLDEHIKMEMNPTQILQGRVPATLNRLRKERGLREGAEPWFFWRDAILQTWEDIYEVSLPSSEVSAWLEPLFDPIVDRLIETRAWPRAERDSWNDWAREVLSRAGLCKSVQGGELVHQRSTLESYLLPIVLERVVMLPSREEPEEEGETVSLLDSDKLKME